MLWRIESWSSCKCRMSNPRYCQKEQYPNWNEWKHGASNHAPGPNLIAYWVPILSAQLLICRQQKCRRVKSMKSSFWEALPLLTKAKHFVFWDHIHLLKRDRLSLFNKCMWSQKTKCFAFVIAVTIHTMSLPEFIWIGNKTKLLQGLIASEDIPHFGERLSVLLNERLTQIYRLTSELVLIENDFFCQFF